jgi:acetylglutamate kinase
MEKLYVIKIGGNVIDDEEALQSFLLDFGRIPGKKILVHGGGRIATRIGEQLGIRSVYASGRRITDAATLELVTMVYGGLVNKKLVAALQALHCNAIGLTGADANILMAVKRPVKDIDYGFAGDISDPGKGIENLELFLKNGLTPVLAPLTHDGKGQILNTNADTIASFIATALSGSYSVRLIYCFEQTGVLENLDDADSVIPLITKQKYLELVNGHQLAGGMVPKIDNAFAAIERGVKEVLIGHAKDLLQNVTEKNRGTLIR